MTIRDWITMGVLLIPSFLFAYLLVDEVRLARRQQPRLRAGRIPVSCQDCGHHGELSQHGCCRRCGSASVAAVIR